MNAHRPIFVVGTGRTGSTALSRILTMHPEVLSLNEYLISLEGARAFPDGELTGPEFWELLSAPHPAFDEMVRQNAAPAEILYTRAAGRFSVDAGGIPRISLMVLPHLSDDPDALYDALAAEVRGWPPRRAVDQHAALFAALCERFGRTVTIERSGASLTWVPMLRRAFPAARFVHMHRDGPDCALSMGGHIGFRAGAIVREVLDRSGAESTADLTAADLRRLPEHLAAWVSEGFPAERTMALPTSPKRFGLLWSEMIIDGLAGLAEVPPESRMALAYEDLLDHPERELDRIAGFAGLGPAPGWAEEARRILDPARRGASLRLPPRELDALREGCAPGQRALSA